MIHILEYLTGLDFCNIVFVYIVQVINFVYNKQLYLEWDSNMRSFIIYMYLKGTSKKLIMCHISVESASNIAITTEKRTQILSYGP